MTASNPLATVVICTRNRAATLARALESIATAAETVTEDWELLVVDNGSTDDTPAIVESFSDKLPIRRHFHSVPGLSNARNAAVESARGLYLIWTDDDLTVDRKWLSSYLDAFRAFPHHALFGGRAIPRYDSPVQSWFVECEPELTSLLAIRDAPDWDEIDRDRLPYGLNYAVRTDVQRRHLYDPSLGVAPGRRLGGEETEMIRAALRSGETGRWVWDATVFHHIPPERQTAAYVFRYYRAHGFRFPDQAVDLSKGRRPINALRVVARLIRKGGMAAWRRLLGNSNWVGSYISFARTIGTWDRLNSGSAGQA